MHDGISKYIEWTMDSMICSLFNDSICLLLLIDVFRYILLIRFL